MKPLKELREEANITQEYMASKLDISKAHYCNLENGKRRLPYPTALNIARILSVSMNEIIFEGQDSKMITNKELGDGNAVVEDIKRT